MSRPEPDTPAPAGRVSLTRIERRTLVLALLFLAASLPFRSVPVTVGVAVGEALAVMNWIWLKSFFGGLLASRDGKRPSPSVLLYTTKYVITGGVVFVALRWRLANVFGLLAGLLVVILAVTLEGLRTTTELRKEGNDAP